MIKGLKRRFYNVDILVLLLFLISLVIGILVADDYGLSWDIMALPIGCLSE